MLGNELVVKFLVSYNEYKGIWRYLMYATVYLNLVFRNNF